VTLLVKGVARTLSVQRPSDKRVEAVNNHVAEDLAALRSVAEEHGLSPREVLWTALSRTARRRSDRVSLSAFYYAARTARCRASSIARLRSGRCVKRSVLRSFAMGAHCTP
jgi:hypothetical protein